MSTFPPTPNYVACLEMGGTTSALAIADSIGSFVWKKRGLPSAAPLTPKQVITSIAEAFKTSGYEFSVLGIASFGPLDLIKGRMGNTPKPGWANFPLITELQSHFPKVKIILETDVNAPAYSEYLALAQKIPGPHAVAYLTVGTGVGLGLFSDGKSYHGLMHPEFGHVFLARYPGDTFQGVCPFHPNCLEGLISAVAMAKRLGINQDELPNVKSDDKVWDLFAFYIGEAAAVAALSYAIDYFVVGGGIMTGDGREFLFDKANEYCSKLLNGYINVPKIVLPEYKRDAGLVGASAVALHPEVFVA
jgi:fructokinase